MPTLYFHTKTIDGAIEEDVVGAPFDNKEQAIREAYDYVKGVMQDVVHGAGTLEQIIEVTDEQGNTVIKLDRKTSIQTETLEPGATYPQLSGQGVRRG